MDVAAIKNLLAARLSTRTAVERAAATVGVSVATLYRYKANPEAIDLGTLGKLYGHLGMPLGGGTAWGKPDVVGSELRRLELEKAVAAGGGARLTTVDPYTVNVELAEITLMRLQIDYGSKAKQFASQVMAIRAARAALYKEESYDSWEIWSGPGYSDFFHGRKDFKAIPQELRRRQIDVFIETSAMPRVKRYIHTSNSPGLPMIGLYSPPGVALQRIEDVHIEHSDPTLVEHLEEAFEAIRGRCQISAREDLVGFLRNPPLNTM